ncbi:MAG: hypothetical protein WBM71_06205 [Sedimenticolaceae bacterium]
MSTVIGGVAGFQFGRGAGSLPVGGRPLSPGGKWVDFQSFGALRWVGIVQILSL